MAAYVPYPQPVTSVISGVPMAPGPEPGIFELDGLRLGSWSVQNSGDPGLPRHSLRGAEVLLAPAAASIPWPRTGS